MDRHEPTPSGTFVDFEWRENNDDAEWPDIEYGLHGTVHDQSPESTASSRGRDATAPSRNSARARRPRNGTPADRRSF